MKDLQKQIITDPLTNLFNRCFLQGICREKLQKQGARPVLLRYSVIDLDFFKRINDVFGHDALGRGFAECCHSTNGIRESDVACATGAKNSCLFCEARWRKKNGVHPDGGYGTSPDDTSEVDGKGKHINRRRCLPRPRSRMDSLLRAAEEALYEAKEDGLNCVVMSEASATHG